MEEVFFVRGNPITIEATIKKYTPFGTLVLNDPENGVTITISTHNNVIIINNQPMIKSSIGNYYFTWQSQLTSALGKYECTILVDGLVYDAVFITNSIFTLVGNNDGGFVSPSNFLLRDAVTIK
jgi:hypothetical protein